MRVQRKRGFTLVELVIVIAVIAILAAVLIPTFAGVIDNSKKSAALQEATTATTVMIVATNGTSIAGSYIGVNDGASVNKYWFEVGANGKLTAVEAAAIITTSAFYDVKTAQVKDLSDKVTIYALPSVNDVLGTTKSTTCVTITGGSIKTATPPVTPGV